MPLRFIHVVADGRISFFFYDGIIKGLLKPGLVSRQGTGSLEKDNQHGFLDIREAILA